MDELQIALVGGEGVGKTSLVSRFISKEFPGASEAPEATTKFGVHQATLNFGGQPMRLRIFDTPGSDAQRELARMACESASAVLVVFDLTVRASLDHALRWTDTLGSLASEGPPVALLVGNKCDMVEERRVEYAVAKAKVGSGSGSGSGSGVGLLRGYVETSAKLGTNVDAAFVVLASQVL
jgi:small GTP-binding protein